MKERTPDALNADRAAETHLGQRQRRWWLETAILVGGVAVCWSIEAPQTIAIAFIVWWVVFSLKLDLAAIMNEMFEINDQLAGRKDELKALLRNETKN